MITNTKKLEETKRTSEFLLFGYHILDEFHFCGVIAVSFAPAEDFEPATADSVDRRPAFSKGLNITNLQHGSIIGKPV